MTSLPNEDSSNLRDRCSIENYTEYYNEPSGATRVEAREPGTAITGSRDTCKMHLYQTARYSRDEWRSVLVDRKTRKCHWIWPKFLSEGMHPDQLQRECHDCMCKDHR